MAGASRQGTVRGGAAFEIASIEAADGRLVISGCWSGVRGMRFVRPTLVFTDRQILASLEHKPWPPDADPWIAAFPWDGAEIDPDAMSLSVAPSITVPLGAEPRFSREERSEAEAAATGREEIEHARREAERERTNALAQLEEAIADREAAVRTRGRMEAQRDEAEAERQALEAERDDALERLGELRAHLDEVLLANEELQQRLRTRLAAQATTSDEPARPAAPRDPDDDEEPIGVRAIPAARAVSPQLHRSQRARDLGASPFDVWAIRVLGTVAAICFILLLVMFLSLFV